MIEDAAQILVEPAPHSNKHDYEIPVSGERYLSHDLILNYMLGSLKTVTRHGVRIARSIFSGKPSDYISVEGGEIIYSSNGVQGRRRIGDLAHICVEQSFLGLFGSSLILCLADTGRTSIRGLDNQEALKLNAKIEALIVRGMIETAKQRLENAGPLVVKAHAALHEDAYMSAWQMARWAEKFADLRFLTVLDKQMVKAASQGSFAYECRLAMANPDAWRRARNDRWVAAELEARKSLLDGMGTHPLTDGQKQAILRHDNRVLAVAGAGTGKTTTVVCKVSYLLKTHTCLPQEILLLSFSRGAVDELAKRVKRVCGDQVQVRTFHSLGLEIVSKGTGQKPALFGDRGGDDLVAKVTDCLAEMLDDPTHRMHVINFLAYHFFPSKDREEFQSEAEYLHHASATDIRTLKGERVRSNQEAQIANWLFLNGVNYVYEAEYQHAETGTPVKRVYCPDFYLLDYEIYIEHFGIDRVGNTAPWVPRDKYHEGMRWKRDLHRKYQTVLLETFSYDAREGRLAHRLKSLLVGKGVELHPRSLAEIKAMQEVRVRLRMAAKFIGTSISLFKGDRLTVEELQERVPGGPAGAREKSFLALFAEVLRRYEAGLRLRGQVDFGDMITEAARLVETQRYRSPFKIIIVDEFQDISRGRAWLMNALLEQVEDTRLLCVGDDWQSIYRFAGSDVGLMTAYEKQWPQAVRVDLDRTFRFNDKIQEVSSRFVMRNPVQLRKSIDCPRARKEPAVHITSRSVNDLVQGIKQRDPSASILILGRYNHTVKDETLGLEGIDTTNIRAMTVHKAKGREADYVIVNDVESGRYGFPTEMIDDPLLRLFLAEMDTYPNAEERRLFYVAVTRARHEVWLRINVDRPSSFIEELVHDKEYSEFVRCEENALSRNHFCPLCGGSMTPRRQKANGRVFLSCRNYPRCTGTKPGCPKCGSGIPERIGNEFSCAAASCGWKASACPKCQLGFVAERSGKFGKFAACSLFRVTGCSWTKGSRRLPSKRRRRRK